MPAARQTCALCRADLLPSHGERFLPYLQDQSSPQGSLQQVQLDGLHSHGPGGEGTDARVDVSQAERNTLGPYFSNPKSGRSLTWGGNF